MSAVKGFLKGLLFGSAVGGIVTLLTTEKSGKENREAIKETVDESMSKINDVTTSNGYKKIKSSYKKPLTKPSQLSKKGLKKI